jgi:hypothetical protein
MTVCSHCGAEAEPDDRYCLSCGVALAPCPACGFGNRSVAEMCTQCGHRLGTTQVAAPAESVDAPPAHAAPPLSLPERSALGAIWRPLALALAAAAILIAGVGLGEPPRSGDIPAGYITIAGVDPAAVRVVRLDMSRPIPIAGRLPAQAAHADSVKLTFKAADVELGSGAVGIAPGSDGTFSATFRTSGGRYLLTGKAATQLEFLQGDATRAHRNFIVRSDQWGLATIPAIASIVSLWALLSRVRWLLRSMRRGRRRRTGPIRLAGLGALGGGVFVGLAWLVFARPPLLSTVIVCAALGAAAGACAAIGALNAGDRARRARLLESGKSHEMVGQASAS